MPFKNKLFKRALPLVLSLGLLFLLIKPRCLIRPDLFSSGVLMQNIKTDFTAFKCPELKKITLRPLSYLGLGLQSIAFESADQKYVLKFFLKERLHQKSRWRFSRLWDTSPLPKIENSPKDRSYVLKRYEDVFLNLKEETALIAVHLNVQETAPKRCTLLDWQNKRHRIALNSLCFVIQEKGEALEQAFGRLSKTEQQKALLSLENLITTIAQKGFSSLAKSFKSKNFALIGTKAVMIDAGDLIFSEKQKAFPENETKRVISLFKTWQKKNLKRFNFPQVP
ncbi:MAG: hypothetical protein WC371_01895 [Parachlamydiales bacterium]